MQQYYVFFRCWPGFREPFPFQRFNNLSDEVLVQALDQYVTESLQEPGGKQRIRRVFRKRRDEVLEYFASVAPRQSIAGRWRRHLGGLRENTSCIRRLGSYLGWYSQEHDDHEYWGQRVYFWHPSSLDAAERLVQWLNNAKNLCSTWDIENPQFGFVAHEDVSSPGQLTAIQISIGAVQRGQRPAELRKQERDVLICAVRTAMNLQAGMPPESAGAGQLLPQNVAQVLPAHTGSATEESREQPSTTGQGTGKTKRGRKRGEYTSKRAKFAQRERKKGLSYPAILVKYKQRYPKDSDVTDGALRLARQRVYSPEEKGERFQ